MASGKGCFFRSLTIIGILLIVLAVLLVSSFLLATGAPVSYPAPKFDGSDTGVVTNIITRLARSLVDKEGRVVKTVRNIRPWRPFVWGGFRARQVLETAAAP